jgi:hypothetical protein
LRPVVTGQQARIQGTKGGSDKGAAVQGAEEEEVVVVVVVGPADVEGVEVVVGSAVDVVVGPAVVPELVLVVGPAVDVVVGPAVDVVVGPAVVPELVLVEGPAVEVVGALVVLVLRTDTVVLATSTRILVIPAGTRRGVLTHNPIFPAVIRVRASQLTPANNSYVVVVVIRTSTEAVTEGMLRQMESRRLLMPGPT